MRIASGLYEVHMRPYGQGKWAIIMQDNTGSSEHSWATMRDSMTRAEAWPLFWSLAKRFCT